MRWEAAGYLSTSAATGLVSARPAAGSVPAMSALRRVLPLLGLLVAAAAAVALLHALGDQPWARVETGEPGRWIMATPPVEALMAVLRLAGLAAGWWLLATTTATATATLARAERLGRLVRPLTWAPARRAADRAVAAGVSAVLVASGMPSWAHEAAPPPPALNEPAAVDRAPAGDGERRRPAADDSERDGPAAGDNADAPVDADNPAETADARRNGEPARTHEVAVGESLWVIAAQDLAAHRGLPPAELADAAVAAHWRAVIEANADRLRSGDPDLVFPGEQLRLPAPPE